MAPREQADRQLCSRYAPGLRCPARLNRPHFERAAGIAVTAVSMVRRLLYRGRRPHRLARLLNAAQAQLAARAIGPRQVVALEVVGRRTGRRLTFPVVMAEYEGQQYLVSMFGNTANWVRNVRATGGDAVIKHGGRQAVRLEEVPAEQRAPILRRYLEAAPGARPHIAVPFDAPLTEFTGIAGDYPVFRVTVPDRKAV